MEEWLNDLYEDARWEQEYDLQKGAIESSAYNRGKADALKMVIDSLQSQK